MDGDGGIPIPRISNKVHIQNQQEQSEHKRKWRVVYHRIRCSPSTHAITYTVLNVHGGGDQDVYKNNNDVALAFADDIAQTAMNIEKKLHERMTRWNENFNRFNLKLNLDKIEMLVVS